MEYGIYELLTLLGSLGLFLYGMKVMSDALMEVAGDKMRSILATMTSNRFFAVMTGFLITAIIQSSSATTLMVVSFVNASLLTLVESVGVVMGANIGTTVTAWLITILGFKVSMSALALPLLAFGFLLSFSKKHKVMYWGTFIIGFSILFIGLQFLKDSVPDIKQNPQVLEWLSAYTNLGFWSVLIFLFIGTLLTVVVQSSSATMALTLVMCYEGWIPFPMAAAMVLGENIGTTITANLAAIMANFQAKRTARAHLIFNIVGVIWMLILFTPFLAGINWFVTQNGGDSPFENPMAIPIALSVFHTSFNIINTGILIWFLPLIVRLVIWMIPEKEREEPGVDFPKYLNDDSLKYPQTGISAIIKESRRLFEGPTFKAVAHALNLHREDIKSEIKPKKLMKKSMDQIELDIDDLYYHKVKTIYSKILKYSTIIQSKFKLSNEKMEEISKLKIANRHMVEAIKDSKSLIGNIDKFMVSDNEYIRKEYNKLRKNMMEVLREVYNTSIANKPKKHLKKLKNLKQKAKKSDVMANGVLDNLIRNGLIDSSMATSLANNSECIVKMSLNLIDAAELLYIKSDNLLEDLTNTELI